MILITKNKKRLISRVNNIIQNEITNKKITGFIKRYLKYYPSKLEK